MDLTKVNYKNISYHQEIYIRTTYLSTLYDIIERSIELEKIDITRRGFLSIQKISLSVANDENLDDYVRQRIVENSYLITKFLALKCVEKGIYRMVSEAIFYSFSLIRHAFKKGAYYASLYDRALQYFFVTLIEIAKEDSIDINYWNIGLNDIMWGIAEECLYHFNDQYFQNTLEHIIGKFDNIKKVIESKENKLDNEKTYFLIRVHLETILNTMNQRNLHNTEIEEKISSLLKDFKEKEK